MWPVSNQWKNLSSFLPQTIFSFIEFAFIKRLKTAFSTYLRCEIFKLKVLVFMIFWIIQGSLKA